MEQERYIDRPDVQDIFSVRTLVRFEKVAKGIREGRTIPEILERKGSQQAELYRRLKELERVVGRTLIRRPKGTGRTSLTEDGQRFLETAGANLANLEDFLSGSRSGQITVRIAGGDTVLRSFILPRVPEIRRKLPKVCLWLQELRRRELIAGLSSGSVDFGLLRSDLIEPPFKGDRIGLLEFSVFVTKRAFAEAGRPRGVGLVSAFEWALLAEDNPISDGLRAMAVKKEMNLRTGLLCSSYPQMADAVVHLGLAAPLPRVARGWFGPGVEEVAFPRKAQSSLEFCLLFNPRSFELRPALKGVWGELQSILGGGS